MRSQTRGGLFAGSATYLLSNILNAAIPFALLPVLTRYLLPAEYGQIAMFQAVLGALGAVVGLSVTGAAGRKFFDEGVDRAEVRDFIGSCLQILLASSGIALFLMWVLADLLAGWLEIRAHWLLLAVLVAACSVIVQLRLGQWQVEGNSRKYGLLQVGWSISNVALSLLLVVGLVMGAEGRIDAQVISVVLVAIVALILLRRDQLLRLRVWNPAHLREALNFGVPLMPHIAGIFLVTTVDRFVINAELGLAAAGVYLVAVQLASAMGLVFDAINKAYTPWLFERLSRNVEAEKRQIVRYTYAWCAFLLGVSTLVFVLGPLVVVLVAGEKYSPAGEVIGWLAVGQAFGGMYLMVANYVFYSKRTALLSLTSVFVGVVNVVLLIALTRSMGLAGAGMAFAISMGFRFVLTWWVAQRRHPMPWFGAA